jgi:large subunit ribosomal protein L29
MKIEEIRGKSDVELGAVFAAMKKELFDIRFKSASQSLPDPSRIRMLRRTIARMGTVTRERELERQKAKAS